jgi:hypothetical protein
LGFTIYKTGRNANLTTKRKSFRSGALLMGGLLGISLLYWNGMYFAFLLSSNYFEVSDGHQPFKELMHTTDLIVIGCAAIIFLVLFIRRYRKKFLSRVSCQ